LERLIRASSRTGDLILDPFAGVGTSLVVCKKLSRRFIGVEQNAEFVKIARRRIEAAENELKEDLFQYGT
jgi:site-specific DNA-methyltransferase (adenine-specific)